MNNYSSWDEAVQAAALFALDPIGSGGVVLHALPGPVRTTWLALVRELLPPATPWRKIPLNISDSRLLGGLDLTATLQAGRPVAERGLLAETDGGVVLLAMAERVSSLTAARLNTVLDTAEINLERDGIGQRTRSRFGVIALDESIGEDEHPPAGLLDRLAFHLDLSAITRQDMTGLRYDFDTVAAARTRLAGISVDKESLKILCSIALSLGIGSLRASRLALKAACSAAALAGRPRLNEDDLGLAGRLVLAPRATQWPESGEPPQEPNEPSQDSVETESTDESEQTDAVQELEERVLEAVLAELPANLLAQLKLLGGPRQRGSAVGKAGAKQTNSQRGRPIGVQRGDPRAGARMNVIETLRAAAPWQPLRRREQPGRSRLIDVRKDDFRITRMRQRRETTTIFVVDASGSAALHRLAEAKGAVELLLADCYVRRDSVALIAFRGHEAELLLPPTRSLTRAKRCLAALPGGGGTPLAAGLNAAHKLALAIRRRGATPLLIVLTDGRANIALDDSPGREQAQHDARASGRGLRMAAITSLLVDTSRRADPKAQQLAEDMGAQYLALPYADAVSLSQAVRTHSQCALRQQKLA